MLNTLADLDRERATNALASAARSLSRRTLASAAQPDENASEDDPIVGALIQELEGTVSRRRDEDEHRYLARLSEKLSGAITAYFLRGTDLEIIRARAGQKGTLPISMYRLSFSRHFNLQTKLFAIKKAHVERAVKHADMVEHLSSETPAPFNFGVSLFVQTPRVQGSPYTILVRCVRFGANLSIEDALRIYHDEFDLNESNTPIDVLHSFLQKFGIQISIHGETGNPVLRKKITVPDNGRVEVRFAGKVDVQNVPGAAGEEIDVILQYAFDQQSYASYQRQHGIASEAVGDVSTFSHFASFSMP
jgi:hypothetical protein